MTNVRYLTGFTGSDAALLVSPEGLFFFTDGRYDEQSRAEVAGAQIVVTSRKWQELRRRVRRLCRPGAGRSRPLRAGFESRHLSVEIHRALTRGDGAEWVPLPDPVEELRMVKEEGEVRRIEGAAVAAAGALVEVLSRGVAGAPESEVAADLEREIRRRGAEEVSFRPIVASGARSALPHAVPTAAPVLPSAPLVVDFGARRDGYCSDETLTLFPGAPPRGTMRRVHDAVRRAQEAGIRAVRPGVPCRDVDRKVRESLDRSGYLKYFVHSTGHGVGLEIHERPSLSPRSKDRLLEGMVVTVEPGVYLPGAGGVRIEDTVRVGATRGERITYLPKNASFQGSAGA